MSCSTIAYSLGIRNVKTTPGIGNDMAVFLPNPLNRTTVSSSRAFIDGDVVERCCDPSHDDEVRQVTRLVTVDTPLSHAAIASGRYPKSTRRNLSPIVFFVVLLGLWVPGGTPIAFSFSTATLAYLVLTAHAPLGIIVSRMNERIANLMRLSVLRSALQFVLLGTMCPVPGISGAKPLTWWRSRPLSSPKARAARVTEQQHARQGGPSCALL